MIALILCSHADFSASLKKTAEMICGELEKCETVSFWESNGLEGLAAEIREKYEQLRAQGDEVVCLCDLSHASPYNACCVALGDTDARVVPGMSLPLLINIASERDCVPEGGLDAFLQEAIAGARESMDLHIPREFLEG